MASIDNTAPSSYVQYGAIIANINYLSYNTVNDTLCFVFEVAVKRTIPGIVMSDEEYYENYVNQFIGPQKAWKENILRKGKDPLMETYNAFAMRRFEVFEDDILWATEAVMVT